MGMAGWLYPKADWLPRTLRAKRTLQNLACDDATAHLRSVAIAAGELPETLLSADFAAEMATYDAFTRGRDLFARCESPALLSRLLYVDMKTLLVDEILTKVDRTSMAVGLEVRVPMLDYRLVELSTRIPVSLKLDEGQGKRVLRKVVARWLGPQAAAAPKHGFDVPTDQWFRGSLREVLYDTLMSRGAISRQWLDSTSIKRVVHHHVSGRGDHGRVLWCLLMLEQWAEACMGKQHARVDSAGQVNDLPGLLWKRQVFDRALQRTTDN
jgi:asparagine synthase (glutamine-hydrolysing)